MDKEVMKLLAHIDQTRSTLQEMLSAIAVDELAAIIKLCAKGYLRKLDDQEQLMVGLLAIVSIFELRSIRDDEV